MALDDVAFRAALGRAFERRLGEVEEVDPRLCIPLRQRHAKRYVQPGLALIGDAAHTIHPLAGRGSTSGFWTQRFWRRSSRRPWRVVSGKIFRC